MRMFRRLGYLLRARRHDEALREEMEYHRASIQADLQAGGMSEAEAAAASRRAMGNVSVIREDARDVWLVRWADRLWRDARHGARGLLREPTFALTAMLTLALGVAAITTVFSVVDAELWRPLPFPEPDRLVVAYSRGPGETSPVDMISEEELAVWRDATPALETIVSAGAPARRTLHLEAAESVLVRPVTSNYFDTLPRPVLVGRAFTTTDAGGPPLAVLTERAWQRVFQADPSVVGRTLTLDTDAIVVAGVVASDLSLGPDYDVYVNLQAGSTASRDRTARVLYGSIGRLAPGVSSVVAEQQIQRAQARLAMLDPERWASRTMSVESLHAYSQRNNWRPLYFLLAAAFVLLALTTVNVTLLVLARALGRSREFALRGALGGGRSALAGQLFVEGAVLAIPAGALAWLLTVWAAGVVSTRLPEELARGSVIPVDGRSAVFAIAMALVVAVVIGLVPLIAAGRLNIAQHLGSGSRAGRSRADGRARLVLLTAQLALTVVLVSGAGIFLRSFTALSSVPLGFEPAGAISVRTSLNGPRYVADSQVKAYVDRLLDAAAALPGVVAAAVGTSSPLASGPSVYYRNPDQPQTTPDEAPRAIMRAATPGYFRTLGIPILRGRTFDATHVDGAPRVAVVNEHLAELMFGTTDAVGRIVELLPGADTALWTRRPGSLLIVGVVSDVKDIGLNEVKFANIYVPFAQMPASSLELLVRAEGPVTSFATDVRAAAARVDPAVPVLRVSSLDQRVDDALHGDRFNLMLVASFASVALLLAAIGVYGAVAYAVQARTREFGVRLAFGARPGQLIASALWQAGRLGVLGGLIGLAAVVVMARLAGDALYLVPRSHNGILYGVSMTDPMVLLAAFTGVVAVAIMAASLPARRVTSVDPVQALRAE